MKEGRREGERTEGIRSGYGGVEWLLILTSYFFVVLNVDLFTPYLVLTSS